MLASPGVLEQQGEEEPRVISQAEGGRAGGERSAAGAAAAVRPTALPPAPAGAPANRGGRVPAHRSRARPLREDRGSAALRPAVSCRWVARTTAPGARKRQSGYSGADVPSGVHGFREGTLQTAPPPPQRLTTHVHTCTPVSESLGLHPRGEFKEGTTRCTSPRRSPRRFSQFAHPQGVREPSGTERATGGAHGLL